MKTLSTYLTEKLKLSDINRDAINGGEWIDAKHFKLKNLKSGNVVQLKNKDYFLCVSIKVARERFRYIPEYPDYDIIFVSDHGSYLRIDSYTNTWPENENMEDFDIIRVNTRQKDYKDYMDVCKDLNIITTF